MVRSTILEEKAIAHATATRTATEETLTLEEFLHIQASHRECRTPARTVRLLALQSEDQDGFFV